MTHDCTKSAEPRSVIFNEFVLQVLISTLPSVILVACLPLIATSLGLSFAQLGTLFLIYRAGMVLGGQVNPALLRKLHVDTLAIGIELLNFVLCLTLFYSVQVQRPELIFPVLLIKAIGAGSLANSRAYWLKNLLPGPTGQRVLVIANTVIQGAYGINGLLLLNGISFEGAQNMILFDAASSLVGAYLFYRLSRSKKVEFQLPERLNGRSLGLLWTDQKKWIFITDVLLAVAMGGTNIFVVMAGDRIFEQSHGYAYALILYSLGFLVSGWIVQADVLKRSVVLKRIVYFSPVLTTLAMGLVFASFQMRSENWIGSACFYFLVFCSYPMFFLKLDTLWFAAVKPETASATFALRSLIIGLIWALGEGWYARMDTKQGFGLRIVALSAAAVGAYAIARYKKTAMHSPFP